MKEKKISSQENKRQKLIKVLCSNSHTDRPKISMEGKWLEQIGFHIGDRLQVDYKDKFIFISHALDMGQQMAVHETVAVYQTELDASEGPCSLAGCQGQGGLGSRQIKVASSVHVRQNLGFGGPLYYPERPKISIEGKWLEKAGFCKGDRLKVEYQENAILICPAV